MAKYRYPKIVFAMNIGQMVTTMVRGTVALV